MISGRFILALLLCALGLGLGAFPLRAAGNLFLGYWSLHLPGGGTGWLGVDDQGQDLQVQMLWRTGSVFPVDGARLDGEKLVLTRRHETNRKSPDGKPVIVIETITAELPDPDHIKMVSVTPREAGGEARAEFAGHRQAPLPPAPDLSRVQFGPPEILFNGTNLDGWQPVEPRAFNGWHADQGRLINTQTPAPEGGNRSFANLRTVAEFEDFALYAETRVPKDGNSGIYIRGTDEIQIMDTFGRPVNSHNMGALYSRIVPTSAAEKPAGEWQTVDITYVARHVTVVLNGTKIIDNQPVLGPTGGALWPEMDRPGPIYLQGDHTGIEYRNLILRRVVSE